MVAPPAKEKVPPPGQQASANRAKLTVEVPADAKLYINDRLMRATSTHRTFHTPTLEPDQQYYYDLRAEVVRDGKILSQTQRIIVKRGTNGQLAFDDLTPAAADKSVASADR